jgi:hypothetical protein
MGFFPFKKMCRVFEKIWDFDSGEIKTVTFIYDIKWKHVKSNNLYKRVQKVTEKL